MSGAVLVKYGEIFLKSEPVKKRFEAKLLANIRRALAAAGLEADITSHRGRILLSGSDPAGIAAAAAGVFGVVAAGPCTLTPAGREELETNAVSFAAGAIGDAASFAVRARRSGMKGFSSQELAASIGEGVLLARPDVRVDLRNPSFELFVEARDTGGIIYSAMRDGPGGLPLGTQGPVLSLLSAGIDSPVASWLMMRRGCTLAHFHCDPGRFGGEAVRKQVIANHTVLSRWAPGLPMDLYIADLAPFYEALCSRGGDEKSRCVVCKRFMMRVAVKLAEDTGAQALVTGDSIGQVASQTLTNIGVVGEVVPQTLPILRPLIGWDKDETVRLARTIGTFTDSPGDLSCALVPKYPLLEASMKRIRAEEERIGADELCDAAVRSVTCCRAVNGRLRPLS
jgi:thiamine biosynthesis protein ThiI